MVDGADPLSIILVGVSTHIRPTAGYGINVTQIFPLLSEVISHLCTLGS